MPLATATASTVAFGKVAAALELLVLYAPARAQRVCRLGGILIFGITKDHSARYFPRPNLCQLWKTFVLASETTPERLATTLVHEATHAWLFRLGFGYEEAIRLRIERVCERAALRAARCLPNGAAEVEYCERQLNLDAEWLTNENFDARTMDDLRQLGFPEWIIRAVFSFRAFRRRITFGCSRRAERRAAELKR